MSHRLMKTALLAGLLTSGIALWSSWPVVAQDKSVTAEQVVESVIFIYGGGGGRAVLEQIRRNGVERGEVTRMGRDGRTETADYSWRFVRGQDATKDKFRWDQKSPTLEYALVHNGGSTWGIINGASFVPRQDAMADFLSQQRHGLDALLRYKENGSTIALVTREKKMGLDLYVIDLTDKDKRRTRYYITTRTDPFEGRGIIAGKVLWLEYEEPGPDGVTPVKYTKKFYDYRYAQSTWVPKRTVTLEDGKQVQEVTIKTITYGVKLEDSLFKNPDAPAPTASATPGATPSATP